MKTPTYPTKRRGSISGTITDPSSLRPAPRKNDIPEDLASSEPWIGTAAGAEHVGASIPTFRRWIKLGYVNAKRTPTGELRFRRSELDNIIR